MEEREWPFRMAPKALPWATGVLGMLTLPALALRAVGLVFIIPVDIIALPFFAAVLFAWLMLLRSRTRRAPVRVALGLLLAGTLCVGGLAAYLLLMLGVAGPSDYRVEASPSGKNRLIIIERGFIDSTFSAYPLINAWMYRVQDNRDIAYRDFGGDVSDPEVTWTSDTEAHVTLNVGFMLCPGSTNDILVRFD